MINYLFLGATWLIGIVGIGGAVAVIAGVCIFGPAAVSAILQPLLARFLACRWCEAILVATIALVAAYWIGHHTAAAECRAEALSQELAIKQADLDNAKSALADATQRANSIEAKANAHADTDAKYIASLKAKGGCTLDSGDIGTGGMRNFGFHLTNPSARSK